MQQAADNAVRSAALTGYLTGSTTPRLRAERSAGRCSSERLRAWRRQCRCDGDSVRRESLPCVITKIRANVLGGLVGQTSTIKARAVAGYGAAPCIVALRNNSTGTTGIAFNGNGSVRIKCGLYSNSTSSTKSIAANGGVGLTTPYAGMAGCTNASISNMHCTLTQVPNPYAAVAASVPTQPPTGTSSATKSGNTYSCSNSIGCTVAASTIAGSPTFNSGAYYVTGGSNVLNIGNAATFRASNATIWVEGGLKMGAGAVLNATNSVFLFPSKLTGSK